MKLQLSLVTKAKEPRGQFYSCSFFLLIIYWVGNSNHGHTQPNDSHWGQFFFLKENFNLLKARHLKTPLEKSAPILFYKSISDYYEINLKTNIISVYRIVKVLKFCCQNIPNGKTGPGVFVNNDCISFIIKMHDYVLVLLCAPL